jgi:hypothetical protein
LKAFTPSSTNYSNTQQINVFVTIVMNEFHLPDSAISSTGIASLEALRYKCTCSCFLQLTLHGYPQKYYVRANVSDIMLYTYCSSARYFVFFTIIYHQHKINKIKIVEEQSFQLSQLVVLPTRLSNFGNFST